MEAGRDGAPNFELPQPPSPETGPQPEQAVEAPPAAAEKAGEPVKRPALPTIPDEIPAVDQPVIAAPPQDLGAPDTSAVIISDTDRPEPIWINRVDSVVARTKDDPYKQTIEMSKVKVDYQLKRFGHKPKADEAAG